MENAYLHHVSVPTKDVANAVPFYTDVLGFKIIQRPAFTTEGRWLNLGSVEVHVTLVPNGTFPVNHVVGSDDIHFAIRVHDFQAIIDQVNSKGYSADLAHDDPKRIIIKPKSKAGYSPH
jgi:catechol 2,3-dioxygenase-like lactoylglutathione lyase family enzyme